MSVWVPNASTVQERKNFPFGRLVYVKKTGRGKRRPKIYPARIEFLDLTRYEHNKHHDPELNKKNYLPVTYFGYQNEVEWVHEDRIVPCAVIMLCEFYKESNGYNYKLACLNETMPIIEDPFFRLQTKTDSIEENGKLNFDWMDQLKSDVELPRYFNDSLKLALWEMIHKTQLGSLSRSNGNNQRVYPAQKEEQQIWLEQHNAAIEVESQFQSDFMDCSMANKPCPDPPNVAQLAKWDRVYKKTKAKKMIPVKMET